MKKLLALLLLSPLVVSEELEYPVELTCELGAKIIYVYLAEDISKSWIKHIDKSSLVFEEKKRKGMKLTKFKKLEVDKDTIKILVKDIGPAVNNRYRLHINRYTLKASSELVTRTDSGKCFMGFKEYKNKKI